MISAASSSASNGLECPPTLQEQPQAVIPQGNNFLLTKAFFFKIEGKNSTMKNGKQSLLCAPKKSDAFVLMVNQLICCKAAGLYVTLHNCCSQFAKRKVRFFFVKNGVNVWDFFQAACFYLILRLLIIYCVKSKRN